MASAICRVSIDILTVERTQMPFVAWLIPQECLYISLLCRGLRAGPEMHVVRPRILMKSA